LRQVLRNLLRNASLYGGERVVLRADVVGGEVEVRVEDDGPGVPPAEAEGIFARYGRGSRAGELTGSGVGIGLHLSHTLAGLMDGDLRYQRRGGWTCFALTLPLAGRPAPAGVAIPAGGPEAPYVLDTSGRAISG
ncbi:MAG: sensor histidine kinase, partial [Acidimicrobiia bacterium]